MDTKVAWPSGHVAPEQPQIHSINSSVEKLWKLERFPNDVEHHFCYKPVLDSTKTRLVKIKKRFLHHLNNISYVSIVQSINR